jgi:D-beta-D-heptose 7-phosphate kinase/D-beta-D-heptose 1-phosphate adenosyltransferase
MKKVWINGTFDVLHIGHLYLIREAAKLGSVKIGIDSDARVKFLKGESRPINNVVHRREFLFAIKGVDSVEVFSSEDELIDLISKYSPDYFVIGSDYKDKRIIGAEFAKEIIFIERLGDYSSTSSISQMISNEKNSSNR